MAIDWDGIAEEADKPAYDQFLRQVIGETVTNVKTGIDEGGCRYFVIHFGSDISLRGDAVFANIQSYPQINTGPLYSLQLILFESPGQEPA